PNYFHQFSHYATRIIDDAVPVKLTPRGKEALARGAPLPVDPHAQGFLDSEILLALLAAIKPTGWIGAGLLVGDLLRLLRKSHRLRGRRARRRARPGCARRCGRGRRARPGRRHRRPDRRWRFGFSWSGCWRTQCWSSAR